MPNERIPFKSLRRAILAFFAWHCFVVGVAPGYGLSVNQYLLLPAPASWVAPVVFVCMVVSFFLNSREKAVAIGMYIAWLALMASTVRTPQIVMLYSGFIVFASIVAGIFWYVNDGKHKF